MLFKQYTLHLCQQVLTINWVLNQEKTGLQPLMLWFQAGKIWGIIFSQTAKDTKSCKKIHFSIVNVTFKQFLFHSWQPLSTDICYVNWSRQEFSKKHNFQEINWLKYFIFPQPYLREQSWHAHNASVEDLCLCIYQPSHY